MKKSFFVFIKDLFIPPKCVVCGEVIFSSDHRAMCNGCFEKYKSELEIGCPFCLKEYSSCICRPKNFLPYEFAYALPYDSTGEGCARKLILCCKNRKHKAVLDEFVGRMVETAKKRSIIKENLIVTYVPRSPEKAIRLGNDQAKDIAESFSKRLSLTCLPLILRSSGGTDQKLLSGSERRLNAIGRYRINPEYENIIKEKNILIIDDVVTTGSSVNACVELMQAAGALSISCLAAAKSLREHYEQDKKRADTAPL